MHLLQEVCLSCTRPSRLRGKSRSEEARIFLWFRLRWRWARVSNAFDVKHFKTMSVFKIYLKPPTKRSQHFNATYRNILGHGMLHTFGHPVAICWVLLVQVWKWPNFSANSFRCCIRQRILATFRTLFQDFGHFLGGKRNFYAFYLLLNNRARGLYCKIPDWGMKFLPYGPSLLARSIKKKFQPEFWSFTVKPEQTRLLSCLSYGFRKAKRAWIERTSTLPSFSVTISSV